MNSEIDLKRVLLFRSIVLAWSSGQCPFAFSRNCSNSVVHTFVRLPCSFLQLLQTSCCCCCCCLCQALLKTTRGVRPMLLMMIACDFVGKIHCLMCPPAVNFAGLREIIRTKHSCTRARTHPPSPTAHAHLFVENAD